MVFQTRKDLKTPILCKGGFRCNRHHRRREVLSLTLILSLDPIRFRRFVTGLKRDGFTDLLRLHQLENHRQKPTKSVGGYLGILGSCLGMLGGFVHMTRTIYFFKKDESNSHLAESLQKKTRPIGYVASTMCTRNVKIPSHPPTTKSTKTAGDLCNRQQPRHHPITSCHRGRSQWNLPVRSGRGHPVLPSVGSLERWFVENS